MYHLSIYGNTERFACLVEVFVFCDAQSAGHGQPFDHREVSLVSEILDEIPVTTYSGQFAIRAPGNAAELMRCMFSEVRDEYFREGDRQREPHEIERRHWSLLGHAFALVRSPKRFLSLSQIDACSFAGCSVLSIAGSIATELLGFGEYGPTCALDNQPSLYHGHHLGAALLANRSVPPVVLAGHRAQKDATGRADWVGLLVKVPELRGSLSHDQIRFLATICMREQIDVNSLNA